MSPEWLKLLNGYRNDELHRNVEFVYSNSGKNGSPRVFPSRENLFRAFSFVNPHDVRVVILGQDPYPQPGNACGLCFAVPETQPVPGSLQHIFLEINQEFGTPNARHSTSLEQWARQGVLLLNTILSVEEGRPMSHSALGWQSFTDHVIRRLSETNDGMVFLLWGNPSQAKSSLIDETKHLVIRTTHPSGLSWGRLADGSRQRPSSFWGSGQFVRCNEWLVSKGKQPVIW